MDEHHQSPERRIALPVSEGVPQGRTLVSLPPISLESAIGEYDTVF